MGGPRVLLGPPGPPRPPLALLAPFGASRAKTWFLAFFLANHVFAKKTRKITVQKTNHGFVAVLLQNHGFAKKPLKNRCWCPKMILLKQRKNTVRRAKTWFASGFSKFVGKLRFATKNAKKHCFGCKNMFRFFCVFFFNRDFAKQTENLKGYIYIYIYRYRYMKERV